MTLNSTEDRQITPRDIIGKICFNYIYLEIIELICFYIFYRSPTEKSPLLVTRDKLRLSLENDANKLPKKESPSPAADCAHPYTSWETLVLFALNFTKLNVQMNMGNVMGNVVWLTKAFRSDGSLSIR